MPSQPERVSATSTPIRVVIAAARSSFREILRNQLDSEPSMQVVGDAPDARTARVLMRRLKPHILVIECALNRELARAYFSRPNSPKPATGVVVIVESASIQNIVEALEFGANGVVLRASLPAVWRTGIESILAGQYWIEDKSVAILLGAIRELLGRNSASSLQELRLTTREMEIAHKIADGCSNKEVGRNFAICERTVKHHLTNIFRKTGVSSRLELAMLVRDKNVPRPSAKGLLPPPDTKKPDQNDSRRTQLYLVAET